MAAHIETVPKFDLHAQDLDDMLEHLESFHAIYSPFFQRREQKERSFLYLQGLLSELPSKAIEPMMLHLLGDQPNEIRGMQHFIAKGSWSDEALLAQHLEEVDALLGEEDGVLIIDPSGFPRQGQHSAGVKRQWCGQLGKRANCQVGVFVGYASSKGYALLAHRLYIPREWLEDEKFREKREKCGIPENLEFKNKLELGQEMVEAIYKSGKLRCRYVLFDAEFGRDTKTLDKFEELGLIYYADIPENTMFWEECPRTEVPAKKEGRGRTPTKKKVVEGETNPKTVKELAASISPEKWSIQIIKEGSKGAIVAKIATLRVFSKRGELPGDEVWLVLRKNVKTGELKYHVSNEPADAPFERLVHLSGMRWPIEICFEDGKQILGMGDFEGQNWRGWNHHMTLSILAHFFLTKMKIEYQSKAPALTLPQVRAFLGVILPKRNYDKEWILEITKYRQRRNYAAYLSHRKRRIERLNHLLKAS